MKKTFSLIMSIAFLFPFVAVSQQHINLGVAGESGFSFAFMPCVSLDLRAQYYYGLTNLKTNQSASSMNSFVLLFGVKYQL
jgi:hypothetical protein